MLAAAVAALALAAPAPASDGIYETCYPLNGPALLGCIDRLNRLDALAPNVGRVLNYGASEGPMRYRRAYARAAAANGQRLIWPVPSTWPCYGPGSVARAVNVYSELAGTWGYYIGEEGRTTPCSGVIHRHDPRHPRLYVDGARDSSRIDAGDVARFRSFAGAAEKLGVECYPVKSSGTFDPATCGDEARKVRPVVTASSSDAAGAVWAVGQSFSWSDACRPACTPQSLSGPYPTRAEQCAIRRSMDAATAHMLWFDYFLMNGPTANMAPPNALARLSDVIGDPDCGA